MMLPRSSPQEGRCAIIPHSRPTLGAEDAEALLAVLASGHIAQGPAVNALECVVADRLGRRSGVATSSGTAALALALASAGVGAGDEVVLPAYACSALAHAVRFVGATPALADIGEDLALTPAEAARRITGRTRAIVLVHPFGHQTAVDPFLEWGVPVIEDCAQALGASRCGRPAGSTGAAAVCSFYATKMVAAGEGGMVLADAAPVLDAARAMRSGAGSHPFAFNLKLSDIAAALGLAQMHRLDDFVARRRAIADAYDATFTGTAVRVPERDPAVAHCFSRYVVRVRDAGSFIDALAWRGIEAKRPVGDPLLLDADASRYPEAVRAFAECVSLPIYPTLDDHDVSRVVSAVAAVATEVSVIL